MIIPYNWLGMSPPQRRRTMTRATVQVETLEGRALLSKGPGHGIGEATLQANYGEPVPPNPNPGPIHNIIGNGYAIKSARFYPEYFGPKQAELNVASAIAVAPGDGTLQLNGQVVLPINTAPTDPSQNVYYLWAINRGGAKGPGPIPGRPGITFDAAVVVAVQTTGVTAYVKDLTNNSAPVQLPSSDFSINNFTLRVSVPLSMLPATGGATDPSQYTVNFSAWNGNPLSANHHAIASFVPEFRNFHVRDATAGLIKP
ncbi:MAG: hypothetical protein P4L84_12970 [Isosphaeraceae bacterium]|nr:hypothetical protein [Isosphaeraceae bacterium]